uniref:Uncharacterized protein n=1 Tax=Lactuca sativa TaxID=4236 RepID=A0A9R1XRM4_LACSA|nr:hypothetical protein LSAT_V11C300156560 [Lactuca sativa]
MALLPLVGTVCFRGYGSRSGELRRKSIHGCIVSQDVSVLNLVIGDNHLAELTDVEKRGMTGPKRVSKIRQLFNLSNFLKESWIVSDFFLAYVLAEGEQGSLDIEIGDTIDKAKSEATNYHLLLYKHLGMHRFYLRVLDLEVTYCYVTEFSAQVFSEH